MKILKNESNDNSLRSFEDAVEKFEQHLEKLVRSIPKVVDYSSEQSTKGFHGTRVITVQLEDGTSRSYSFDYSDQIDDIIEYGSLGAAQCYYQEILEDIE